MLSLPLEHKKPSYSSHLLAPVRSPGLGVWTGKLGPRARCNAADLPVCSLRHRTRAAHPLTTILRTHRIGAGGRCDKPGGVPSVAACFQESCSEGFFLSETRSRQRDILRENRAMVTDKCNRGPETP